MVLRSTENNERIYTEKRNFSSMIEEKLRIPIIKIGWPTRLSFTDLELRERFNWRWNSSRIAEKNTTPFCELMSRTQKQCNRVLSGALMNFSSLWKNPLNQRQVSKIFLRHRQYSNGFETVMIWMMNGWLLLTMAMTSLGVSIN